MVEGRPEQVTSVTSGGWRTHASPSKAPGTISASLGSCPHSPAQTHTFKMQQLMVSTGYTCVRMLNLSSMACPSPLHIVDTSPFHCVKLRTVGYGADYALLWHLLESVCTLVTRMWISGVELPFYLRRVQLSIMMLIQYHICFKNQILILYLNIYGISLLLHIVYSFSVSPWRNRLLLLLVSCCILIKETPPLMSLISSSPAV